LFFVIALIITANAVLFDGVGSCLGAT